MLQGSISSRHIVVVRPSYPVDGLPATVQILSLAAAAARDPLAVELQAYPGPLVKGNSTREEPVRMAFSSVERMCEAQLATLHP